MRLTPSRPAAIDADVDDDGQDRATPVTAQKFSAHLGKARTRELGVGTAPVVTVGDHWERRRLGDRAQGHHAPQALDRARKPQPERTMRTSAEKTRPAL
jgi:hypothetical protein